MCVHNESKRVVDTYPLLAQVCVLGSSKRPE